MPCPKIENYEKKRREKLPGYVSAIVSEKRGLYTLKKKPILT